MPLPKEALDILASGNLDHGSDSPELKYFKNIPSLDSAVISDDTSVLEARNSTALDEALKAAGLSKAERAGMSILLNNFSSMGGQDVTVGDIRGLSETELTVLRGKFDWGRPSENSIKKVKRLFG